MAWNLVVVIGRVWSNSNWFSALAFCLTWPLGFHHLITIIVSASTHILCSGNIWTDNLLISIHDSHQVVQTRPSIIFHMYMIGNNSDEMLGQSNKQLNPLESTWDWVQLSFSYKNKSSCYVHITHLRDYSSFIGNYSIHEPTADLRSWGTLSEKLMKK